MTQYCHLHPNNIYFHYLLARTNSFSNMINAESEGTFKVLKYLTNPLVNSTTSDLYSSRGAILLISMFEFKAIDSIRE